MLTFPRIAGKYFVSNSPPPEEGGEFVLSVSVKKFKIFLKNY